MGNIIGFQATFTVLVGDCDLISADAVFNFLTVNLTVCIGYFLELRNILVLGRIPENFFTLAEKVAQIVTVSDMARIKLQIRFRCKSIGKSEQCCFLHGVCSSCVECLDKGFHFRLVEAVQRGNISGIVLEVGKQRDLIFAVIRDDVSRVFTARRIQRIILNTAFGNIKEHAIIQGMECFLQRGSDFKLRKGHLPICFAGNIWGPAKILLDNAFDYIVPFRRFNRGIFSEFRFDSINKVPAFGITLDALLGLAIKDCDVLLVILVCDFLEVIGMDRIQILRSLFVVFATGKGLQTNTVEEGCLLWICLFPDLLMLLVVFRHILQPKAENHI